MAIALHHSRAKGAAKLILIGIANHDGDGGAWPSIATLAKYGHVTERNAQKSVAELESLGEIRRLVSAGGTRDTADHLRPNLYKFLLSCPADCDRSKHHRRRNDAVMPDLFAGLSTGVSQATPGVVSDGGGVSPTTPEPSMNQTIDLLRETRVNAPARINSQQRYADEIARKCPMRRDRPHSFEDSGYCTFCGCKDPQRAQNRSTGEIA
ncbi:helix-turn-helix domain-containing protein [Plantibacter flavus]|uniref:helix-turn-helix domain-containing protein n=1 Tax=Plantibacter flavus TaxID=150123 RepID=UPI0014303F5D|nr:helix-turn-helix domain-containing protein [Plantibacter flavus]